MRLCPWSLALASSIPVLGLESVCPRKDCPWPWPRPCVLDSTSVGKSKLVSSHQTNWIISRKELKAAKLCSDLLLQAKDSLQDLNCSLHCCTDSQVVLGWLTNPDLNLSRFVKRRVDRILQVAPGSVWKYIDTSQNPADVGTRDVIGKNPECIDLWLGGAVFLRQEPVSVAGASVCLLFAWPYSKRNHVKKAKMA